MATAEDGHEQLIEDMLLADNDLADLLAELAMGGSQLLDGLDIRGGNGLGGVHGWMLIRVVGHFTPTGQTIGRVAG
jgi:hypothetical protein